MDNTKEGKANLLANDLFDLIKAQGLPKSQQDDYAQLSRQHENEAKKNFFKLLKGKNISVGGNGVKIGKHILIKIEII